MWCGGDALKKNVSKHCDAFLSGFWLPTYVHKSTNVKNTCNIIEFTGLCFRLVTCWDDSQMKIDNDKKYQLRGVEHPVHVNVHENLFNKSKPTSNEYSKLI